MEKEDKKPEDLGNGQDELDKALRTQESLKELGVDVPPALLAKIEEISARISEILQSQKAEVDSEPEISPEKIEDFRKRYEKLPEDIRKRETWEKISERLFANDSEKLKLVLAMQGGGELFGVDKKGRALFKDVGPEPVMYGYDKDSRAEDKKLIVIYDRDPDEMKKAKSWASYPEVREILKEKGYELFPYQPRAYGPKFNDELKQVENQCAYPFVRSLGGRERRLSYVECGEINQEKGPGGFFQTSHLAQYEDDEEEVVYRSTTNIWGDDKVGAVRLLRV